MLNSAINVDLRSYKIGSISNFPIALVALLLFLSAIAMTYCKEVGRSLFVAYGYEQKITQELQREADLLMAAKSKLVTPERIQNFSKMQFAMQFPAKEQIILLHS
jgi:cell division protein FtsL